MKLLVKDIKDPELDYKKREKPLSLIPQVSKRKLADQQGNQSAQKKLIPIQLRRSIEANYKSFDRSSIHIVSRQELDFKSLIEKQSKR